MSSNSATRELFPDVETLLSPETMSALDGRPVREVRCEAYRTSDALSGSHFLRVELDGDRARRYILKRVELERDWISRAAGDRVGRATLAWRSGLLERVPPEIDHTVVACAHDGESGRAVLMHDVGDYLVPPGDGRMCADDHDTFLAAMAALHAAFWGRPDVGASELGFIDLYHHYHILTPATARREAGSEHPVPAMIGRGWSLLPELAAADVNTIVAPLLDDPTPLCAALEPFVVTVGHGDWKLGNMGITRDNPPRVILLDWDRVGAAPPGLDLSWYLAVNSARLPEDKEAVTDRYRAHLEKRLGHPLPEGWWERQLTLCLLGAFLQLGWPKLLGAASDDPHVRARESAELDWWSDRVREAATALDEA